MACDEHSMLTLGLIADTHGVFDPTLRTHFKRAHQILHAGDVGHHGEVRDQLRNIADLQCVRGNVDETAPLADFPDNRTVDFAGWTVTLTHICGDPPSEEALALAKREKSDVLIFGHSHKFSTAVFDGILFINPGSAGPARFRLPRSVALLRLPEKESGKLPQVERIDLDPKAPPRILAGKQEAQKRKRK